MSEKKAFAHLFSIPGLGHKTCFLGELYKDLCDIMSDILK